MDERSFWFLIESAWQAVGGKLEARRRLAQGRLPAQKATQLVESQSKVIAALHALLNRLPADELLMFDHILERKLYDIDRADIQEHADGSDDGFLYARGFIVAAGRGYYDAVRADPALTLTDTECEDICYLSRHLYREKFGDVPPSDISRESCSNTDGWLDLA